MSGNINPRPGTCSFFVKRKHRFCKLITGAGKKFCGEHNTEVEKKEESSSDGAVGDKPERVRVPCPLDPKHTVWSNQLKKHLRKCNSRAQALPVYHQKSINKIGSNDSEECTQITLSSMSKVKLLTLIDLVQTTYKAHSIDIPTKVLTHSVLEEELAKPKNGVTAQKHLCQVASLLGQLGSIDGLGSNSCYMEFGAGRGQMSHWVRQAVQDQSDVSFILVDRATIRHKMDTKHRLTADGPSYERLKIDIEHLCLGKVPSISANDTPLVAYSKHLCGAATDLTLHCLLETIQCKTETESPADNDDDHTTKHSPRVNGIVIALCCHHRCDWTSYVGRDWWLAQGLTSEDFNAVTHMSSWATCGPDRKMGKVGEDGKSELGNKVADDQGESVGKVDSQNVAENLGQSITTEESHQNTSLEHSGKDQIQATSKSIDDMNSAEQSSGTEKRTLMITDDGDSSKRALSAESDDGARKPKVAKGKITDDVHTAGGYVSAQRLVGLDVQQREDIGRQCKRLIDIGRLMYLERLGFKGHLVYYIDRELSLENVAMVAVPI